MTSSSNPSEAVMRVQRDRLDEAVDVLCEAFHDYPVMRFFLRDAAADAYDALLVQVVGYLTDSRLSRGWPVLATEVDGRLVGVANVTPPDETPAGPELEERQRRMFEAVGSDSVARMQAFAKATAALEPEGPWHNLGMIGVRDEGRGDGHGRRLLEAVARLAEDHPESLGVVLTTEVETNLDLYRHFGYRLLGVTEVDTLRTWTLCRSVRGAGDD